VLIDRASLWFTGTNAYVVADGPGLPALIVDAPPDPEAVLSLVTRHDLVPVALLVTHGHVDHMGGAASLVDGTAVTAYMHPDDDWLARDPESQLRALFGGDLPGTVDPLTVYQPLADGQLLELAPTVEVLHTPGHTPGHCCFLVGETLFSGDQLFAGGIGRTDLPGGDYGTLMESMAEILKLSEHTEVLPGHGPSTTLAHERRSNPYLQDLIE